MTCSPRFLLLRDTIRTIYSQWNSTLSHQDFSQNKSPRLDFKGYQNLYWYSQRNKVLRPPRPVLLFLLCKKSPRHANTFLFSFYCLSLRRTFDFQYQTDRMQMILFSYSRSRWSLFVSNTNNIEDNNVMDTNTLRNICSALWVLTMIAWIP